jgi:uncharacterized protein YndB with AHSA1/START domain/DNA-binding transcriptional ArsR family regulator
MDFVFRALADPTRRALLDELFARDGQTLGALESRFAMTRFGVMKHLRVLEDAGLVVARRRGREKVHHLNPVPIRLVHDRWVSKYAEPWTAALSQLKQTLEVEMQPETELQLEKVFEIYIRTSPQRLWEALTDPGIRAKYNFGAAPQTDWSVGSALNMQVAHNRFQLGDGEVLESDPPRRLVHTMRALWGEDVKAEGFSRVTYTIEQVEDSCRLMVIHDRLRENANEQLYGGWPMVLSGLKTWLETGELLTTPGLPHVRLTARQWAGAGLGQGGAGAVGYRLETSWRSQPLPSGSASAAKLAWSSRVGCSPSASPFAPKWNGPRTVTPCARNSEHASTMSDTTRCRPCSEPAAGLRIRVIEHADPGGVSWTMRKSSPAR